MDKGTKIEQYVVSENETIISVMKKLDTTAKRILFVVDRGVLTASVTDGDIRRWIIGNGSLEASVIEAANKNPISIYEDQRKSAFRMIKENEIDALPVLDNDGKLVDIVFRAKNVDRLAGKKVGNVVQDTDIVIMAGGLGTRLYPYTKILPKPLIPVGDTPIVELIMNEFHKYGASKFYMILNHKKEMIKSYFAENKLNYEINFIDEDIPLGTGGGLSLLRGVVSSTFILSNCDILITEDINCIIEEHKKKKNVITMVCSVKEFVIPYGIIELDNDGQISDMKEKPSISFLTNTGCYIVEPDVLDMISDSEKIGFPDVIDRCRKHGMKVGVFPVSEDSWYDMGQMDELRRMEKLFI